MALAIPGVRERRWRAAPPDGADHRIEFRDVRQELYRPEAWHRARADRAAPARCRARACVIASRATHSASGWRISVSGNRAQRFVRSLRAGARQRAGPEGANARRWPRQTASRSVAAPPHRHLSAADRLPRAARHGWRRRGTPLGGGGHRFQCGDADQRIVQRQPQPAHEGQADALAGEGAGAGRDGQPVQRCEVMPLRIVSSTIGARRSAWPRSMASKMCAMKASPSSSATEQAPSAVSTASKLQRILQASSKLRRAVARPRAAGSP